MCAAPPACFFGRLATSQSLALSGQHAQPRLHALVQVEKGSKQYKLDSQGNIVNADAASAAAAPAAPAASPFAAAFGGGGGGGGGFTFGSDGGASAGGGGGFTFGAPPAGGGFVFGGAAAPAANGGGFTFGGAAPAPASAPKRSADPAPAPQAKRSRTNALRLTGGESGCVLIVGNGDCGQLGLGGGEDDVRDSVVPLRMSVLDGMRICQVKGKGGGVAVGMVEKGNWQGGPGPIRKVEGGMADETPRPFPPSGQAPLTAPWAGGVLSGDGQI